MYRIFHFLLSALHENRALREWQEKGYTTGLGTRPLAVKTLGWYKVFVPDPTTFEKYKESHHGACRILELAIHAQTSNAIRREAAATPGNLPSTPRTS
jgi:hypothetical protein